VSHPKHERTSELKKH